jgi:acyl-CoA synthetase (NDP forming)
VFLHLGVTRFVGLDELLEVSAAFARTRPPKPPAWAKKKGEPAVCVYAISGGTGAHMADMLAAADINIPPLSKDTQTKLHDGLIPAYLRVSTPVDCG